MYHCMMYSKPREGGIPGSEHSDLHEKINNDLFILFTQTEYTSYNAYRFDIYTLNGGDIRPDKRVGM